MIVNSLKKYKYELKIGLGFWDQENKKWINGTSYLCANCGKMLSKYEANIIGKIPYCDECLDNINLVKCHYCSTLISEDECYITADNYILCEHCYENKVVYCSVCEACYYNDDNIVYTEDEGAVCRSCFEKYGFTCDYCGNDYLDSNKAVHTEDEYTICSYCAESLGKCDHCGGIYYDQRQILATNDNYYICKACWKETVKECDYCGHTFYQEVCYETDEGLLCSKCYEKLMKKEERI